MDTPQSTTTTKGVHIGDNKATVAGESNNGRIVSGAAEGGDWMKLKIT